MKYTIMIACLLSGRAQSIVCDTTRFEQRLNIVNGHQESELMVQNITHDENQNIVVDPMHEERVIQDIEAFVAEHNENAFIEWAAHCFKGFFSLFLIAGSVGMLSVLTQSPDLGETSDR